MAEQKSQDAESGSTKPVIPAASERLDVVFVPAPHPSALDQELLLSLCELRTQRRSGPGGQHRNKTSSGVFLTHRASGIVGEATERRSQADNRAVALRRLRYRLAVEIRTVSMFDDVPVELEKQLRDDYRGHPLKLNDANEVKPAVLALLLNDLHACGGQPSAMTEIWSTSTSRIVALLKSHPQAFGFVNEIRAHHGRRALK